jgi:hypothetical protein
MTISGIDVLLVGPGFRHSQALTNRMRRWGFRCHFAGSVRRANELVDLVLSNVTAARWSRFWPGGQFIPTASYCVPLLACRR